MNWVLNVHDRGYDALHTNVGFDFVTSCGIAQTFLFNYKSIYTISRQFSNMVSTKKNSVPSFWTFWKYFFGHEASRLRECNFGGVGNAFCFTRWVDESWKFLKDFFQHVKKEWFQQFNVQLRMSMAMINIIQHKLNAGNCRWVCGVPFMCVDNSKSA